jgi:hypothetical protein
MSKICITPVNEVAAETGVWGKYRGVDMLIARSGNQKFEQLMRVLTKPHERAIERGNLDKKTSADIWAEVTGKTILLDWKNFPGGVEYSNENAKALILNDRDAAEYIKEFSETLENYLSQEIDDTVEK